MTKRDPIKVDELVKECVTRISGPKDREFVYRLLKRLVDNNGIPLELLAFIPEPPQNVGKTRFDQLYDAAMELVFPGYRETTLTRLLGEGPHQNVKIWRAMFPAKYGITHVLLRADSYQRAFALACDYVCRVSLFLFGKIPTDLTVRVMFMSEAALRRHLTLREANRKTRTRKRTQLVVREITHRQLNGARLAALGPQSNPDHSIFHYAEKKDLRRIRELCGSTRISKIESESFRKPRA